MGEVCREHLGGRICVADPLGYGRDVLEWLEGVAADGS